MSKRSYGRTLWTIRYVSVDGVDCGYLPAKQRHWWTPITLVVFSEARLFKRRSDATQCLKSLAAAERYRSSRINQAAYFGYELVEVSAELTPLTTSAGS